MPAAKTLDAQSGKVEDLEIWDSWPVQDAKTGYVSNWNGYQLVIGMMGVQTSMITTFIFFTTSMVIMTLIIGRMPVLFSV